MDTIKVIGSPLYQWELGRKVMITPPPKTKVDGVEFAHKGDKDALRVYPQEENGLIAAEIPNILLQSGEAIYAYLVYTPEGCMETTTFRILPVVQRPKPADYIYTETEVWTVERAVAKALEEARESGDFDGKDGEPGKPGAPGKDGYTPVKGIDYWTEADKEEIVKETEETAIGDVDKAIDELIEIQNELIGNGGSIPSGGNVDLSNYHTKGEMEEAIEEAVKDIPKGDVDLSNYYTKAETDTEIAEALANIPTDAHINELINTALGVIENGTY